MRYVNSNVARKLGRLYRWRERFWARRYQAITVSDEEEAQVGRLVYILRHGCKEGLVGDPGDWPGVQVVHELCRGYSTVHGGIWHDQSAAYEARRRGEEVKRRDYDQRYSIALSVLPCWQHRKAVDVAKDLRDLVQSIVAETRGETAHHCARPLPRFPGTSFLWWAPLSFGGDA